MRVDGRTLFSQELAMRGNRPWWYMAAFFLEMAVLGAVRYVLHGRRRLDWRGQDTGIVGRLLGHKDVKTTAAEPEGRAAPEGNGLCGAVYWSVYSLLAFESERTRMLRKSRRGLRRHHVRRLKRRRRGYWYGTFEEFAPLTRRALGVVVNTPKPCSCWMCGNPRKHWRERSLQEIRADFEEADAVTSED